MPPFRVGGRGYRLIGEGQHIVMHDAFNLDAFGGDSGPSGMDAADGRR
jgi:hypothetical protein